MKARLLTPGESKSDITANVLSVPSRPTNENKRDTVDQCQTAEQH